MRICIIGQEEPVYFGPFLRSIIKAKSNEVVLVAIAGSRGAGGHPKTSKKKIEYVYTLWLIMEPYGFIKMLLITLRQKFTKILGLIGTRCDKHSIEGEARKHNIPVIHTQNPNSPEFINKLHEFAPDVIINQSELLLKKAILQVPKIGIINRHGSLLPHFRGRLASFWSHFREPPEYGATIHFVDKGIDSGPIILQERLEIEPSLPYAKVLEIVFKESSSLILEALEKVASPDFVPQPNRYQGTHTYLMPTLKEAKEYRKVIRKRRESKA